MKNDIITQLFSKKNFIKKEIQTNKNSLFKESNSKELNDLVEIYLYHAFFSKYFIITDDDNNHSIKFNDRLIILQSFIDLKLMGISKQFFEFSVYQAAIEGI